MDSNNECINIINGEPGELQLLWPTFQRPLLVYQLALFATTVV
jgi:hypothetical protein